MRIVGTVAVFILSWLLAAIFFNFVGLYGLGNLAWLPALIPAWLFYRRDRAVIANPVSNDGSAATFSWKGVDVYQEQGYFTYRGHRFEIANVTNASYETSGNRGCLGGTYYKVHIHMKDMKNPRVTVGAGNVTHGGNDETERNYERLCIALGCR